MKKSFFLQFHHKYHKDIPSDENKPKPQQMHIKAFMRRGNLHKVGTRKGMHVMDTCYRDDIGDEDDESWFDI